MCVCVAKHVLSYAQPNALIFVGTVLCVGQMFRIRSKHPGLNHQMPINFLWVIILLGMVCRTMPAILPLLRLVHSGHGNIYMGVY